MSRHAVRAPCRLNSGDFLVVGRELTSAPEFAELTLAAAVGASEGVNAVSRASTRLSQIKVNGFGLAPKGSPRQLYSSHGGAVGVGEGRQLLRRRTGAGPLAFFSPFESRPIPD